jgi:hypothetical protein
MNATKSAARLIGIVLVALLLTACGQSEEERIEISIALTQTAAVQETQIADIEVPFVPTDIPELTFPGDLQPLHPGGCGDLAVAMRETLAVVVNETRVAVEHEGKSGGGCQSTAVGSGLDFDDQMSVENAMRQILETRGWREDTSAATCLGIGGWGPGASTSCFTQANGLCEAFIYITPSDDELCQDDEAISACFARLSPEQIVYTASLTCAQDTGAAAEPLEPLESELMRIEFPPGAIQARVLGDVTTGGIDHYVLTAMAGQEMTVNLLGPTGEMLAQGSASLIIWGAEGTVLISSHADAVSWGGELPLSQDYYIDVKSLSQEAIGYMLEVIIPPLPDTTGAGVFPKVEPFPFGEMQAIVLSGVPPMLPPEFPTEEGLPDIYPYLYTSEEGEYEISLDYGVDCRGAGACHYGSLTGRNVDSDIPVGTSNFPFDIGDAQVVSLVRGITGYFVASVCGANCDDGRVFWIYEGYQYMVGLKAGALEDVITLANAAIMNSLP